MPIHAQQTFVQTVVGESVPLGSIIQFAGSSAPTKWMICDGQAVSRTEYDGLFTAIGTTYGSGDGSTTFNLPNFKGRVPVGLDSADTAFDALGETGGSKTSTAAHTHDIDHNHGSFTATSGSESQSHNHIVAIDHDHNAFDAISGNMSANASHGHGIDTLGNGVGNLVYSSPTSGSGLPGSSGPFYYHGSTILSASTQHTHTTSVNVPAFTGNSSSVGNASQTHNHTTTIDVPALGTTASGASSAGANDGNLQPYIVVNYIIKVA